MLAHHKVNALAIAVISLLDFSGDFVLYLSVHDWRPHFDTSFISWSSDDVGDILLFSVLRIIAFCALGVAAVTAGTPDYLRNSSDCKAIQSPARQDDESKQPLLQDDIEAGKSEVVRPQLTEAQKLAAQNKAALRKNVVLGLIYIFSTCCQLITGIKMVSCSRSSALFLFSRF